MFIYLTFFLISLLILRESKNGNGWLTYFVCVLLSLLAGFRDRGVGTDTLVYTDMYFSIARHLNGLIDIFFYKSFEGGIDKGFLTLAWIAVQLSNNIWCFYFFIELVITLFSFAAILRLNKINKSNGIDIYIFAIIWIFLQYNASYNAMRQSCAMSIIMFALSFALEKRWILYGIWSFVAFLFHSTSLIAIVIPFIYFVSNVHSVKLRRVYLILCVVGCIVVITTYSSILNYVNSIGILNKDYSAYDEGGRFEGGERLPYYDLLLIILQVALILICYRRKMFTVQMLTFHIMILLIYFASLFLGLYNVYAARIGMYFYSVSIIMWSIELSNRRISVSSLYYVTVSLVVFSWWYRIVYKNAHETIPYTSSILGL